MTDPLDQNIEQEYRGIFVGGPIEGQERVVLARRNDMIPVTVGQRLPTDREIEQGVVIQPEVVNYRIEPNPADDGPQWLFVLDEGSS